MSIKIAFAGKMRAGKDHAVSMFMANLENAVHMKFADPIYDIVAYAKKVCGFTDTEKERKFLQFLGTDWARRKNPDVWVNNLVERSQTLGNQNMLVSDARFKNEFEALHRAGYLVVKIERRDFDRLEAGATWKLQWLASAMIRLGALFGKKHLSSLRWLSHASEREQDLYAQWDYVIRNDGNLSNYNMKLAELYSYITETGGRKPCQTIFI